MVDGECWMAGTGLAGWGSAWLDVVWRVGMVLMRVAVGDCDGSVVLSGAMLEGLRVRVMGGGIGMDCTEMRRDNGVAGAKLLRSRVFTWSCLKRVISK